MPKTVRTRFAPSPTGFMHIGNLRTALYEYLIAKSGGGEFILRIEDTDQGRYVDGAIELIYSTLRAAGLRHDEGPDVGGPCGPYVQSERKGIYAKYAGELIERGGAYRCFCTKERLAELREENERAGRNNLYDRCCLRLTDGEASRRLGDGAPHVIRQKMPREGATVFRDSVFGEISVENSELEDQILIKSDGLPTYNFANVVDDHLMGITHVVRGSEYLSSAPKYNLLYEAFGWEVPEYVHLPVIVKDGGQKMSKRAGDASFEDLLGMGYLPEAIVNYIALLGWSPRGNREFFTLGELAGEFSVGGISKSPSTFDFGKLRYFNAEYIRRMPAEAFAELAGPYIRQTAKNPGLDERKIARTVQQRTEALADIPPAVDFYDALPDYPLDLFTHKKMKTDPAAALVSLRAALPVLEALGDWTHGGISEALAALAAETGVKGGQIMWPLRVALSGKAVTPGGAVEIAEILGKAESASRIVLAIGRLEAHVGA
ncbi:MAG: glutamate--tRNA ligase [Clostridiales bacterium]|jgi:glutamyl-tRNA synthetase|nr:glutamate--tRNA ligase [Clostridiales bacterium]